MEKDSQYKNPLSRSIIIGCLLFTLLICIIMGAISFFLFRSRMMQQFEKKLGDIVTLTEERIDVDDLDECITTKTESAKFKELADFMDQVVQTYDLDSIVLIRPLKEGDKYDVMQVLSGLRPEERAGQSLRAADIPLLGDRIGAMLPPGFPAAVYTELLDCYDMHFSASVSEFGKSYNAVKGIYKKDGTPVALLTAGLSLEFIDTTMRNYIIMVSIISVLLSIVATMFMVLWLRRRVTWPLSLIESSARSLATLAEKSHGLRDPDMISFERPDIDTGDELESLTDTLVTMSEELRSYVKDTMSAESKAVELRELAIKDALTGIRNKTAYDNEMRKIETAHWSGELEEFGLAMIDLNYLKKINDNYGHDKGNITIKKLCTIVCTVFEHSPVFRIGGDEFVVILRGGDYRDIDKLIDEFYGVLKEQETDKSLEPWERVSAAIGYASYGKDGNNDPVSVFKAADARMYEAKARMKAGRES